mmetsp:Transcript_21610/g.37213  ORF Transcript_21610/g.37213 Transcript_21610/m.37213 type:complete len:245 (+) Transcript_21610:45-779(+)|eukprot:CAMPEP_0184694954 /NCGR_PEP_ID=MMETSP0313-20130426/2740_1 /TAXON_ID=2792 /ORGANISM="Porphyridium aerugineum, Strain SAG 1380-2" /LENGTH=244 /DNA_ID=CAMNT_0027153323 /DNA_START=33 /DNA_END=767 /DNA_ORIENTATION=-
MTTFRKSEPKSGFALKGSILVLVVSLVIAFFGMISSEKYSTFVFNGHDMHAIANDAILAVDTLNVSGDTSLSFEERDALRAELVINHVVNALKVKYPDHILPEPQWIFNNAGGAMGSMLVLHCSLSEYVIIFGTALGTEGHTGRFLADDYFTILHGEQWAYSAGSVRKEVYKPGDQHLLRRYTAKQYRMPDSCWALEYARGNILSMIPFGLLDTFTSTMDLVPLTQTIKVSLVGMVRELLKGKI